MPLAGGGRLAGRRLGKYQLGREVGRGGFGTVFEATDTVLERRVALKVIRLDALAEDEDLPRLERRFLREARAAAGLSHPGIIAVHDVGQDGGIAYIAMELVDGKSLRGLLRERGRLSADEVMRIGTSLAAALDYAHGQGILHRDIKPENVLMRADGIVKVADFGLAKALGSDSGSTTREGGIKGTPSYMSPEHLRGEEVDARSDVFSVAALFYELVTGKRPFASDSIAGTVYKILHEQPRDPHLLIQDVPAGLSAAIMRGLAKEPAERFASCAELVDAFGAMPTIAIGTPRRAARAATVRAGTRPTGALVLLGAMVIVATVLYVSYRSKAAPPLDAAADRSLLNPDRIFSEEQKKMLEDWAKTNAEAKEVLERLRAKEAAQGSATSVATPPPTPSPEARVASVLDRLTTAVGLHDIDGVMACMAPTLEVVGTTGTMRELPVVRSFFERGMALEAFGTKPAWGELRMEDGEARAFLDLGTTGSPGPQYIAHLRPDRGGWRIDKLEQLSEEETIEREMLASYDALRTSLAGGAVPAPAQIGTTLRDDLAGLDCRPGLGYLSIGRDGAHGYATCSAAGGKPYLYSAELAYDQGKWRVTRFARHSEAVDPACAEALARLAGAFQRRAGAEVAGELAEGCRITLPDRSLEGWREAAGWISEQMPLGTFDSLAPREPPISISPERALASFTREAWARAPGPRGYRITMVSIDGDWRVEHIEAQ